MSYTVLMVSVCQDEFEMSMRLLGARSLKEVVREMVDASNIHHHVVAVPDDKLYHSNCELAQDGSMRFTLLICGFADESLQAVRLREIKSNL